MQTTLKFFRIIISANLNYAQIESTGYRITDNLDTQELHLLYIWFDRNSTGGLKMDYNFINNQTVGVFLVEPRREVYGCQDTLQERVEELLNFEQDFFTQVDYIKQPKF